MSYNLTIDFDELLYSSILKELDFWTILIRLLLAMLVGGVIGLERGRKNQPAGFRTFMIVSMGAALTMIFAIFEFNLIKDDFARTALLTGVSIDVARYSAQVINGIGFLSAGMILVTSTREISGITTAASMMASACMGIACGAGFYACIIVVFPIILFSIVVLPRVEEFIKERSPHLSLYVGLENTDQIGKMLTYFKSHHTDVYEFDIERATADDEMPGVIFALRLPKKMHHSDMVAQVSGLPYVTSIQEI